MRMEIIHLTLHWGEPKHPTEMRAWTGTLAHRPNKEKSSIVRHDYTSHEIVRWYGISYKQAWFFGFTRFGLSTEERSEKLPSYVIGAERERWNDYDTWPLETDDDTGTNY